MKGLHSFESEVRKLGSDYCPFDTVKLCFEIFSEQGIDFWLNGYWASKVRGRNPLEVSL